jgi:hypothetical protein
VTPIKTAEQVTEWLRIANPTAQQTLVIEAVVAGQMSLFCQHLGYNPVQQTFTEYQPRLTDLGVRDPLIEAFEGVGNRNRLTPMWRYNNAHRTLQLQNLPVRSVTSVYENPVAWDTPGGDWPAETLLDPTEYFFEQEKPGFGESGLLIRNSGSWERSPRCVKIVYVAGYTAQEITDLKPHLELAFYMACQIAYNAVQSHIKTGIAGGLGVVTAESLDSWSVSYDPLTSAKLYGMMGAKLPGQVAKMLQDDINYSKFF